MNSKKINATAAASAEPLPKKILRKKLLEQMEFYFSDSNLTKDRFLKKEIENSNDGYIDLKIFLQFNKIRLLTTDLEHVRKSVKKSEFLELNDTHTMVRRRTSFVELTPKDIDKKTIYVENIPSSIKNDELKKYFEKFGKVSYISLPKFKTTNQLKGFAFIEFDQKEDSKKAIEHFKSIVSSDDDQEPIGKFPKYNAQIIDIEKKIKKVNEEIQFTEQGGGENGSKQVEESSLNAKRKLAEDEMESSSKKEKPSEKEKSCKKKVEKINFDEYEQKLRVVSKKNWLKLKDQFLEKQKQEVDELKKQLAVLNKRLEALKNDILKQKNGKIKTDDITRECIIKILLNLNVDKDFQLFKLGRQQFKDKHLKEYVDHIAYVDIEKNSNKILIRCKSSESVQALLKNAEFLKGYSKSLLRGEEEDSYFKKIYSNRNKKQEKKGRKQNV